MSIWILFVRSFKVSPLSSSCFVNTLTFSLDSYLEEFLSNINIPINQSPEQKLANLHVYDIAQEGGNSQQQPSVLSVDLYLHVEEHIKVINWFKSIS